MRSRRICFCARATWYLVRARVRARVRVRVRVRGLLLREGGVVLELHLRLLAYELRDLAHALPLTQPRLGLGLEQQRLDLRLHHVVVLALQQLLQLARVEELG